MIRSVKVHNKTGLIRSVHGVSDQPRMKGPAGGAERINWKEQYNLRLGLNNHGLGNGESFPTN